MQPTNRAHYHIVGQGACDYIRATTSDLDVYDTLLKMWTIVAQHDVEGHNQKYMQYIGRKIDQGFIGTGKQRGAFSAFLEATGSRADIMLESMLDSFDTWNGNIPRIDLQITIQRAESWDNLSIAGRKMREDVRKDKSIRGRKPEIRMVDNSDSRNENTIYIGKRENSQRMIRIYDKLIGNVEYVRFEIEYHDKLALAVWNEIKGGRTMNSIVISEMKRYACNDLVRGMIEEIEKKINEDGERMMIIREDGTAEKRLAYLEQQLMAMARKLALEGYSAEVRYILESILIDI